MTQEKLDTKENSKMDNSMEKVGKKGEQKVSKKEAFILTLLNLDR